MLVLSHSALAHSFVLLSTFAQIEENQNHHAVILEWIIIILIVVEVLLDMLHLGFY